MDTPAPAPTVKVTPNFKVGETIIEKATGAEFKILEITLLGMLRLPGRAGLMPPSAAEKKI